MKQTIILFLLLTLGLYGCNYEADTQIDQNMPLDVLQAEAKKGDPDAQYQLGEYYSNRDDYTEAVKWYRKAADQGHIKAVYGVAFCYKKGQGVPKDDTESAKWYNMADDINAKGKELISAVQKGNLNTVKELIKDKANVNITVDGKDYYIITPLLEAVRGGHLEIVKELIKARADVNQGGIRQSSIPLFVAVRKANSIELLKMLVQAGADINVKVESEKIFSSGIGGNHTVTAYTVLHIAAESENCGPNEIKCLLDLGADPNIEGDFVTVTYRVDASAISGVRSDGSQSFSVREGRSEKTEKVLPIDIASSREKKVLLKAAMKKSEAEDPKEAAARIHGASDKANAYLEIAKTQDMAEACKTLDLATETAALIPDNFDKLRVYRGIVAVQVEVGNMGGAKEAAALIPYADDKVKAYLKIAETQVKTRMWEEARKTFELAKEAAALIPDAADKASAYVDIASAHAKIGNMVGARETLDLAREAAALISNSSSRRESIKRLIKAAASRYQ